MGALIAAKARETGEPGVAETVVDLVLMSKATQWQ
jgi:hypothetical protein